MDTFLKLLQAAVAWVIVAGGIILTYEMGSAIAHEKFWGDIVEEEFPELFGKRRPSEAERRRMKRKENRREMLRAVRHLIVWILAIVIASVVVSQGYL